MQLCDVIERHATALIGDRVSSVSVVAHTSVSQIAIKGMLLDGGSHSFNGNIDDALANPEAWTNHACSAITAWLDAKERASA
jgi:hypothetical protein